MDKKQKPEEIKITINDFRSERIVPEKGLWIIEARGIKELLWKLIEIVSKTKTKKKYGKL